MSEQPNISFEVLTVSISKLEMRPTDVLVIKSKKPLLMDVARRLTAEAKRILPEGVKVMVLDGDMDLRVVTQAEAEGLAR